MLNNDLNSWYFYLIELYTAIFFLAQLREFDWCDNLCLFWFLVVVGRTNGHPVNLAVQCLNLLAFWSGLEPFKSSQKA